MTIFAAVEKRNVDTAVKNWEKAFLDLGTLQVNKTIWAEDFGIGLENRGRDEPMKNRYRYWYRLRTNQSEREEQNLMVDVRPWPK